MAALHLEQSVGLKDLGRARALLVVGVFHHGRAEEVEEYRSGTLDVVHALLQQSQEESRNGEAGMIAAVLVGLDLVDDAAVERFGMIELAGFDQGSGKVVLFGEGDLTSQLGGGRARKRRRKLTAIATLLLTGHGGVVLERAVGPVLASPVQ